MPYASSHLAIPEPSAKVDGLSWVLAVFTELREDMLLVDDELRAAGHRLDPHAPIQFGASPEFFDYVILKLEAAQADRERRRRGQILAWALCLASGWCSGRRSSVSPGCWRSHVPLPDVAGAALGDPLRVPVLDSGDRR